MLSEIINETIFKTKINTKTRKKIRKTLNMIFFLMLSTYFHQLNIILIKQKHIPLKQKGAKTCYVITLL